MSPIYVYTVSGVYTAKLTVTNPNGTDYSTTTIYVVPIFFTPLPYGTNNSVLTVANFSTNITIGYAPLSVQFTDLSQNVESRSWDFNNDGTADSYDMNPVYVYTAPGVYTAKMTVTNPNGADYKTATIKVSQPGSSNSNGNKHHGTGTGKAVVIHSSIVSDNDGTGETGDLIKNKNKSLGSEQNDGETVEDIKPISGQKDNTGNPANESKKTPGFEMICGITGLLGAIYVYKRLEHK